MVTSCLGDQSTQLLSVHWETGHLTNPYSQADLTSVLLKNNELCHYNAYAHPALPIPAKLLSLAALLGRAK